MLALLDETARILDSGQRVAAAVIVERHGSAPRDVGARMLVREDGSIAGTIGGGQLEAQVIALARDALSDGQPRLEKFEFSNHDAAAAGMVCGGRVTVLVDVLTPERLLLVRAALQAAPIGLSVLVTRVSQESGALQVGQSIEAAAGHAAAVFADGALIEPLRSPETLVIFGAGHVAQKLAPVAAFAGFDVLVLDDRAEFADPALFPAGTRVECLATFAGVFDRLAIGPSSYLVIVTRGHLDDQVVLEGALRTPAAYIGMIGSRRKRALIDRLLLEQGFSADDLARVHSPIGLPIGAETPEEIAVSIAAELIQVRSGHRQP